MHRTTRLIIFSVTIFLTLICIGNPRIANADAIVKVETMQRVTTALPTIACGQSSYLNTEPAEKTIVLEAGVSDEDIALIALVTMAEAEGECEEGKRLVIDTILNRVDSKHFPNTIYDVIYQPNQFTSMWNGRVERCGVSEEICRLVKEEIESRINYDVIFFNAGRYSKFGTPMFQIGNHYFSSYE